MLRPGAPDFGEAGFAPPEGPPSTTPVPPQAPIQGAGNATAKGPVGAPSSAANGKTERRANGDDSAQPRGPPTGGPAPASGATHPLGQAAGTAPGDSAQPEAPGVLG